ncbi:MAG: hypothetical protein C0404_11100 [Verrucomicrobia bacterium]|nr:hypothetical protein [Verrucomicrobiota bacterium]
MRDISTMEQFPGMFELAAPITRWDEAVPLGNGLMGGLLWGEGRELRLSLDRGDLWDLRLPPELLRNLTWARMQELVAGGEHAKIQETVDKPFMQAFPTKLPAGRLTFTLGAGQVVEDFGVDLRSAVGRAEISGGTLEVLFSANMPVAIIRITGSEPQVGLVAPAAVAKLGYPAAVPGADGRTLWFVQEGVGGFRYVVFVESRTRGEAVELAVTVTSTSDGTDPLALARQRTAVALAAGYDKLLGEHENWWCQFWSVSSVQIPDKAVQKHYELAQYFYGSASRRGTPPIPLQGVWTADEGGLPPWKGDYHHDLNTQLTYWAYLSGGHFEEGAAFLDFMWDLLPEHRRFAREFYGVQGAVVPGVMGLDGKQLGGWAQYSLSPVNGAWVAQAFHLHWRYTMDRGFLLKRALPYCSEIGEALASLLKKAPDGRLKLPLSTSPEIHDNKPSAWMKPNTNFDLALMRWLFGALVEMNEAAEQSAAAARWQGVLDKMDHLAVAGSEAEPGALMLSPDESLTESHRHMSHLMAIHPLGILNVDGSARDRRVIAASLDQIEKLGPGKWVGYSFAWMSCMCARCGRGDEAARYLDTYLKAFVSRNGFHLNGDFKNLIPGLKHKYRPFTLEGNFAAAQAVHEMLLQSWGGVVRVFPAMPARWKDASFENLRTEGAFVVSASRKESRTVFVRVFTPVGGLVCLRNPFGQVEPKWNRADVKKVGENYECRLGAGENLEGRVG